MKRFSIIVLVLLSVVFLVSMVSADSGGNASFVGLWQGIDINDGSLRTISINDNDRDGVYDVFHHDTFWLICGDDSGFFSGFGTVGSNGKLNVEGNLICSSSGFSTVVSIDYEFNRFSDTLEERANERSLRAGDAAPH